MISDAQEVADTPVREPFKSLGRWEYSHVSYMKNIGTPVIALVAPLQEHLLPIISSLAL